MRPRTPLLDRVAAPADLRALPTAALAQLAREVRLETVSAVAETGGHLGANLGVVELTVALHAVFETPADKIVWDVGHQCYPHKILTGRRDRIRTLRAGGGLSGFTKRAESAFDPFGAAHSSTSISAALGLKVAMDAAAERVAGPGAQGHDAIAVIGDGALSAGMAYEALNNAGALGRRLFVVLNDNAMSIAPPVGAVSAYLAGLWADGPRTALKSLLAQAMRGAPRDVQALAQRAEDAAGTALFGGGLFEALGFTYVGPIDGHRMEHLQPVLAALRDTASGPVLLHVVTRKGAGYAPAEAARDKLHGVSTFDPVTGVGVAPKKPATAAPAPPSYTKVFADALTGLADRDPRIVAVTAAMPSGTGLDRFAKAHPGRCFDVGIAEQHGVTFCAGLAAEGLRPFAAIYSTFLQRGYDQVVHDVALQSLPVRFAIDRAGLVGADGPTHAGSFDLGYLSNLPGFVVMAAGDEADLAAMVATAAEIDDRPSAVRYPRGAGRGVDLPERPAPLDIGRGRILREGGDVALLSIGGRLADTLAAADRLAEVGVAATVADARFAKPLDTGLIDQLAEHHAALITVEEGAVGGFGSHVLHHLAHRGALDRGLAIRTLCLPDRFIHQDAPAAMICEAGLDAASIAAAAQAALAALGHEG